MKNITRALFVVLVFTVSYGAVLAADAGLVAPDAAVTPASQPAVATPNPVEAVSGIIKFFKDHNWRPAIAGCITLLVFFWRRYAGAWLLKKIPTKHLPWVVALVGLVSALPAALTVEPFVWYKFLLDGLITSGEAVLLWSTVGKMVLPKVFGEPK